MSFGVAEGPRPAPVRLPGPSPANETYRWEMPGSWRTRPTAPPSAPHPGLPPLATVPIMQGNRGISATPCATAHGAHSGTSASPPRSVGSRRVITARLSHIPMSSGCDLAQTHSQSRWPQTRVVRQDSSTARMAGSLESLWNASLVMAAVCSAHSATTAVAASQAAVNCRNGLFSPLMTTSSHLERVVGNGIMLVLPSSRLSSPRPSTDTSGTPGCELSVRRSRRLRSHARAVWIAAATAARRIPSEMAFSTAQRPESRCYRRPWHPLRARCTSCGGLSEVTPETGGTCSCGQPLPEAH